MAVDDRQLRGFLSLALCRIGKPAIGPLTQRLESSNEILKSCAALTLWQMGEEGIGVMIKNVDHEDTVDKHT
jgi:hypothetical protein